MVPLLGLMYTNKHTHSQPLRVGLFAAFTALSGVATAPLLKFAFAVNPMLVPQARHADWPTHPLTRSLH